MRRTIIIYATNNLFLNRKDARRIDTNKTNNKAKENIALTTGNELASVSIYSFQYVAITPLSEKANDR